MERIVIFGATGDLATWTLLPGMLREAVPDALARVTGLEGKIVLDATKPNGCRAARRRPGSQPVPDEWMRQ